MNIEKTINLYCNKTVNQSEYLVESKRGVLSVVNWSVSGSEKPTIIELEQLYNSNKIQILKDEKIKELRQVKYEEIIQNLIDNDSGFVTKKAAIEKLTTEKKIKDYKLKG